MTILSFSSSYKKEKHISICNERIKEKNNKTTKKKPQPSLETPLPVIHYVKGSALISNVNFIYTVVVLTIKFCEM